jgi:nitrous oxidase accessory protein NosD
VVIAAIVAGLAVAGSSTAATDIEGPVVSDTVWTAADSPYRLVGEVVVGNKATLTIEPGVVVHAEADGRLVIGSTSGGRATLVARGTAADPIRFVPAPATGRTPGEAWYGIRFDPLAAPARFLGGGIDGAWTGGSILEHVHVVGGGRWDGDGDDLPAGGVSVLDSTPYLRDVRISDAPTTGLSVDLDGGSLRVDGGRYGRNGSRGILVRGGSGHRFTGVQVVGNGFTGAECFADVPDVEWRDCVFRQNENHGMRNSGLSVLIVGCRFEGNLRSGAVVAGASASGEYLIRDNVFRGNAYGVSAHGLRLQNCQGSVLVESNRFETTVEGPGLQLWQSDDVLVTGNSFTGNFQGMESYQGRRIDILDNVFEDNVGGGAAELDSSVVQFAGNTVRNNDGRPGNRGGGLTIQRQILVTDNIIVDNIANTGGGILVLGRECVLRGNEITGNVAERGGGIYAFGELLDVSTPRGAVPNRIAGNVADQGASIFNAVNFVQEGAGATVDASFVDWGAEDPVAIADSIWDFFDDETRGIVIADPFQTGLILRDTTWTVAESPIDVPRSLLIGGDATLTIEPGVVVRMGEGTSIQVGIPEFGAGQLLSRGTPELPIRFVSAASEPAAGDWIGIRFSASTVDASFDGPGGPYLAGSVLEHTVVQHTGSGIFNIYGIRINDSAPYLDSVTIEDGARGGIYALFDDEDGSLRIEDCTFRNLAGDFNGGGIRLEGGSGHIIADCHFEACTAERGGGVHITATNTRLLRSSFVGCVAADGIGGGAQLLGGSPRVEDCEFVGNVASESGGGLAMEGLLSLSWVLRSTFTGNESETVGGGLWMDGNGGTVRVEDTVFLGNAAPSAAAVRMSVTRARFVGNQVQQNVAPVAGVDAAVVSVRSTASGGVVSDNVISVNVIGARIGAGDTFGAGLSIDGAGILVEHNLIEDNATVDGSGAGIHVLADDVDLVDNDVLENFAAEDGGGVFVTAGADGVILTGNRIVGNLTGGGGGGLRWDGAGGSLAGDETAFNVVAANLAVGEGDAILYGAEQGTDLDAAFVCWGTTEPAVVAMLIRDGADDGTLGLVLTDPINDAADCVGTADCDGDLDRDGTVGPHDLRLLLTRPRATMGELRRLLSQWGTCG